MARGDADDAGRGARAGRRGAERARDIVHPWAETGFTRAAEAYEQARPSYAPAAVAYLVERLNLRAGREVLDLAAGTGKLTRLLAASGARVVAVEPVAAMRALIPAGIEALSGAAEAIPLADASVDAVTVAQAFQWFRVDQALAEIDRVLRPGGALALVVNLRDESDPLQRAFAETLARHRAHPPVQADLEAVGPVEIRRFEHEHELRGEDLSLLAASESSVATLEDDARDAALADIAALVPPGSRVRLRYVTEVRIRSV